MYRQLYNLIDEEFFKSEVNPSQFRNLGDFVDLCFSTGKQYDKYKESLQKYLTEYLKETYLPDETKDTREYVSVYFVFSNMVIKNKVLELKKEGCCKNVIKVDGKEYRIEEPPAPDLIQWKNKGRAVWPRLIISWTLTLGVCFASYVLFAYLQLQQ